MTNATQIIRHVSVTDVATLDHLLNSAVDGVIADALALSQGIKVTRVGPGDYVVKTAPDVPCGYTIYEQR
ncbi:hypothetical protein VUN82_10320 [Micrococcaceae bacterium Sec5.1]